MFFKTNVLQFVFNNSTIVFKTIGKVPKLTSKSFDCKVT